MNSILVSIIVASYNKANFIEQTIRSVIEQTYYNWELIVVDDGSSDNTKEILSRLAKENEKFRVFFNIENKGANYCRNFGLKCAKGDYVIFLDADDLLDVNCLKNRVEAATKFNSANLLVFGMSLFRKTLFDDERKWLPWTNKPLFDFLRHKLPWQTMQAFWGIEFLKELEGFDEKFKRLQDVELHTRALLNSNVNLEQFPDTIDCYYRIDEERKCFNEVDFYTLRTLSTVMYCNKFEKIIPVNYQKLLLVTIIKLYTELVFVYKNKKISELDFKKLQETLFMTNIYREAKNLKKNVFKMSYLYNKFLFRIPGVNRVFEFILLNC